MKDRIEEPSVHEFLDAPGCLTVFGQVGSGLMVADIEGDANLSSVVASPEYLNGPSVSQQQRVGRRQCLIQVGEARSVPPRPVAHLR